MKIRYHKVFEKQYKKLSHKNKQRTIEVIEIFIRNPHDKRLRNIH